MCKDKRKRKKLKKLKRHKNCLFDIVLHYRVIKRDCYRETEIFQYLNMKRFNVSTHARQISKWDYNLKGNSSIAKKKNKNCFKRPESCLCENGNKI